MNDYSVTLGAFPRHDSQCGFLVWAPLADRIDVHVVAPEERILPLAKGERGYYSAVLDGVEPGALYFYRIDGNKDRPDPASRFQPQDVHGPSQVISPLFPWEDTSWCGPALRDYRIYEIHVGAYTRRGTFQDIIPHLDELRDLGITALEIMPVAQFPGSRNWGYDGAYPFAVQNSYGGPDGLKDLVNECHKRGLAVVLDVVYNHLGPEGNYFGDFGRYFTDRYRSPWGAALNFDGADSDEVRRYFIENALYWIGEFHIDALRLDALHAIVDQSPYPFVAELAETVHREAERLCRNVYLMAESDLNDARLIRPGKVGGYGLDAHWNDDFHHALHALLTGERTGYYRDFARVDQFAKAFSQGFVYSGEYSVYRRRRHGSSSRGIPHHRFVVFSQNHDQVGNRFAGERLSGLVSSEALKVAAGAVILSSFIPLLFMGEEYGETAPFQYFVSHSDPDLVEAVRKGRAKEFASFGWMDEPPDPQAEETFQRSKLDQEWRREGKRGILRDFYRELFRLRERIALLSDTKETLDYEREKTILIRRGGGGKEEAIIVFHLGRAETVITLPWPSGAWRKLLDSAEERWGGQGSRVPSAIVGREEVALALAPQSVVLFVRHEEG